MRAVFLDRDGVINENRADHVKSWEEFRFLPGALDALRVLNQAAFHVFIITNQAIVNRGIISAEALDEMHARMCWQIVQHGGYVDDIAFCPHAPGEMCGCRKPKPGMLLELAGRWKIDLAQSYLVGDAWSDIGAGEAAGCRTLMVRTGRGAEQLALAPALHTQPLHIAADLYEAVAWMCYYEDFKPSYRESGAATSVPARAGRFVASIG